MALSRAPDLGAPKLMVAAAVVATVVAVLILSFRDTSSMAYGLGDTDDAMRMVLVRDLLGGAGWYDQLVERLQPPLGLQMHWSRLIDGGLATLMSLFGLFTSRANAEMATRFLWPMLWIPPVALASLAAARRLGGGRAVFAATILLLTEMSLYLQFRPGRIDHHGPQITLCMAAFAGAALGSVGGAALAGIATGLGLAVGLESLMFEVLIGAFFPLVFLFDNDPGGRRLRAYALAVGGTTLAAFLVQTPPWRWGVVACDALGANLTAALMVAAAALVAVVQVTAARGWRWRLGALALAGVVTAATYVVLDPHCLAGPFADVDPRLKTFWLPYVQEIRPIPRVWTRDHETVFTLMAPCVVGALAWLWLGRDPARRTDPFWILAGATLLVASVAGFSAIRMATYANWVALPIIAAAVTDAVDRYGKGLMIVLAAAACAATPLYSASAVSAADKQIKAATAPKPKAKPALKPVAKAVTKVAPKVTGVRGDRCFQQAAFAPLAAQPPGLAISEIDIGPFVLAYTPSSAMAAPYHRMNWGMLTSRAVMSTEAEAAQLQARKLGVAYVLECAGHVRNADRIGMKADSLQKRLDKDQPPSWLERLDDGATPLRIYRARYAR